MTAQMASESTVEADGVVDVGQGIVDIQRDGKSVIRGIEEFYSTNDINYGVVSESLAAFLFFNGITLKYVAAMIAEKKFQYLYEEITKDWQANVEDDNEIAIQHDWATKGYKITMVIYWLLPINAVLFCTMPAVVPNLLNIILPGDTIYNKTRIVEVEYFIISEEQYWFLFTHCLLSLLAVMNILTAIDGTYVNCIHHVIGLIRITCYRLTNTVKNMNDSLKGMTHESESYYYNQIVDVIKLHQKCIRFANFIEIAYSKIFFAVTVFYLIGFGTYAINLVFSLHQPLLFIKFMVGFIGAAFYMFFYFWPGQKLLDSSDELFNSICQCQWYKLTTKLKFLISFMMLRSTVPFRLTAGPMIEMNFRNVFLVKLFFYSFA
ncbi:uncharacterized protein LOC106642001 [Copidosoma floridanum]|uniref:uncharacterized protein LOC106642001 n=1 Tax=Copidosoma floridanum TaxID=29053 RepID=UPI0006C99C2E|nr:uncharacterized protein LOC106642001 [Copidosoma floridanum]